MLLCYHESPRGHRQVVRHQLPKLTLAGSSPVARSRHLEAGLLLGAGFSFGLESAANHGDIAQNWEIADDR